MQPGEDSVPGDVLRLTPAMRDDVVRIHLGGMGYTLNAQLGDDHLRFLYTEMSSDTDCYVGVLSDNSQIVGVVSGSVHAKQFASRVVRAMTAAQLVRVALRVLRRPRLVALWLQGNAIAAPVRVDGEEVAAVLTAIVVKPGFEGRGAGRTLVAAFEEFLRVKGVFRYRLDTRVQNRRAAAFYEKFGFVEVARRAGSIIYTKELAR